MANEEYIKENFKPDKLWACPSFTGSKFPGVVSPNTEITNLLGDGVKLYITKGYATNVKAVNENLLGQPGTYIINNDKIYTYAGIIDGRYYFTNTILYPGIDLSNKWANDLQMDGLLLDIVIYSYTDGHKEKYYAIHSKPFHYDTSAYSQTIRSIVYDELTNNSINSVVVTYKLSDREISYTVTASHSLIDLDLSIASIVDNLNEEGFILTPIITVKTNDGRTELYYFKYNYSSLSYDQDSGDGELYHINNVIPLNTTNTTPVTIDIRENDVTFPLDYLWSNYSI